MIVIHMCVSGQPHTHPVLVVIIIPGPLIGRGGGGLFCVKKNKHEVRRLVQLLGGAATLQSQALWDYMQNFTT